MHDDGCAGHANAHAPHVEKKPILPSRVFFLSFPTRGGRRHLRIPHLHIVVGRRARALVHAPFLLLCVYCYSVRHQTGKKEEEGTAIAHANVDALVAQEELASDDHVVRVVRYYNPCDISICDAKRCAKLDLCCSLSLSLSQREKGHIC